METVVPISLLGEDVLRNVSCEVVDLKDSNFIESKKLLHIALDQFRNRNGFGR